jgi:hypothetical protein
MICNASWFSILKHRGVNMFYLLFRTFICCCCWGTAFCCWSLISLSFLSSRWPFSHCHSQKSGARPAAAAVCLWCESYKLHWWVVGWMAFASFIKKRKKQPRWEQSRNAGDAVFLRCLLSVKLKIVRLWMNWTEWCASFFFRWRKKTVVVQSDYTHNLRMNEISKLKSLAGNDIRIHASCREPTAVRVCVSTA